VTVSLLFFLWDSSVGIATGYGLDDRMIGVRFSAGAGNFFPRRRVQTGSGSHPASYTINTGGFTLGVKWPGREANHSHPSSAKVNSAWKCTSSPPIRLHGVVLSLKKAQRQLYLVYHASFTNVCFFV
jgi:hypothetical protein